MKKADIKTGVVYAYQPGKNHLPEPIVFLRPPADGVLYEASSRRPSGTRQFIRDEKAAKPERAMFRTLGYATARIDIVLSPVDLDPAELLKLTLADFEKARRSWDTGIDVARFEVVTSLAHIVGVWADVEPARA